MSDALFFGAERAVEDVIEQILHHGSEMLYQNYLAFKCFRLAADNASEMLCAELVMRNPCHDLGELQEDPVELFGRNVEGLIAMRDAGCLLAPHGFLVSEEKETWSLELEPSAPRIDSWARLVVPKRTKNRSLNATPRTASGKERKPSRGTMVPSKNTSMIRGTRAQRNSLSDDAELSTPDVDVTLCMSRAVPLAPVEEQYDAETEMIREQKEYEERMRHLQKMQRLEEQREAARMEAARNMYAKELKGKQVSYDSDGNVILVQSVAPERLPNPNPVTSFRVNTKNTSPKTERRGTGSMTRSQELEEASRRRQKRSSELPQLRRMSAERDSKRETADVVFRRLAINQPSMMEAMNMAPGVQLNEKGKTKKGQNQEQVKRDLKSKGQISRKEYMAMIKEEEKNQDQSKGDDHDSDADEHPQSALEALDRTRPVGKEYPRQPARSSSDAAMPVQRNVNAPLRSVMSDSRLAAPQPAEAPHHPAPPSSLRNGPSLQPAPPPSVHNPRMKSNAVGDRIGPRDRLPNMGMRHPENLRMHPLPNVRGGGRMLRGNEAALKAMQAHAAWARQPQRQEPPHGAEPRRGSGSRTVDYTTSRGEIVDLSGVLIGARS